MIAKIRNTLSVNKWQYYKEAVFLSSHFTPNLSFGVSLRSLTSNECKKSFLKKDLSGLAAEGDDRLLNAEC